MNFEFTKGNDDEMYRIKKVGWLEKQNFYMGNRFYNLKKFCSNLIFMFV